VISAESSASDKTRAQESSFKNFTQHCDDVFPKTMGANQKLTMKIGGMARLLSGLTNDPKLTDFDRNLLKHAIVKLPTKDELVLRN
jgi:hypothetical protein